MRCFKFSQRCLKEILRDPLNLAFGFGFPIVLLLLLNTLQKNIPTPLFTLEKLTPGICVFGLSFMTLFSATLIAKDRETAFLQRKAEPQAVVRPGHHPDCVDIFESVKKGAPFGAPFRIYWGITPSASASRNSNL